MHQGSTVSELPFEDYFSVVRRVINDVDDHDLASDEVARLLRKEAPTMAAAWSMGISPSEIARKILEGRVGT
jgi:hypothetical protein